MPGSIPGKSMLDLWWTKGAGAGVPPSPSVFPCRYRYTSAAYSLFRSTCCSYQKDKLAKPGNFPKTNVLSEIGKNLIEQYFH